MQLQLRPGHDDRPAREVDALAKQVLTEPALLALQHVGERLQRAFVGARDDAAPAAVVEKSVDRFLKHTLLVPDDDVRRAKLNQALKAVVAVDDPAIEIVQVRRRKPAAVERNQRTQLRRDHRNDGQHHPLRAVAAVEEVLNQLQPLDDLLRLQLARRFGQILAELIAQHLKVDRGEHFAHRFGADASLEGVRAVGVLGVKELLLGQKLTGGEVRETWIDDNILLEIQHPLQIAERHVEHEADPGRQRLQEPDMRDRRGELDMAHPFATHLLKRDLDAAFLAGDPAILHALVLAAQALVVLDRAEDAGAEKPVPLRLERAVVDRLRLFDLAEGPAQDPLRGGQTNPNFIEGLGGLVRIEDVAEFIHGAYSVSESRSSTFRPSERISLTRTLNDSGTPASKLSSPLTMLS